MLDRTEKESDSAPRTEGNLLSLEDDVNPSTGVERLNKVDWI
jgi:hypothetical protein